MTIGDHLVGWATRALRTTNLFLPFVGAFGHIYFCLWLPGCDCEGGGEDEGCVGERAAGWLPHLCWRQVSQHRFEDFDQDGNNGDGDEILAFKSKPSGWN